ncbi:hypothetical protein Pmar_PMAR006799 [Perkinsus marinus ATCC 50983]|uniref:Uncharacterized protein n=1 Tax=Perkinsus marinus (strain ATCC 50983 / TXsc) TaxID=423536 RepID=C5K6I7_PERM5|nr:hypothetical protein Pmar_PMAR006799 [Perkinsus marinus ATCC 50983]EER19907.1 hypothetical protein Pmar_PMAR006799 [Perkinsus marinus ATCC 50983]|eukprot:XP_002788111.1 hypothetical protein Pmar_PMAR006799 [Perkinsus marinus ATCC 50983]
MLFRYLILHVLFIVAVAIGLEKATVSHKDLDDDDEDDSDKKTLSDADIHDAIIAHMRAIQAPFEKLKKAYLANRVNRARELVDGPEIKTDRMSLSRRTANIRERLRSARDSRLARLG